MCTIAAISTAIAPAGIGVVRISGKQAIKIADSFFVSIDGEKLENLKGYRAKFGRIFDQNVQIDQVIALVFRSPHSYTGENVVEFSCHGGVFIVKKVLDLAIKNGARLAKPGEFTKQSFMNGKIDLSKAESIMNLIAAQNEKASKLAVCGLEGSLNKKINIVKNQLIDIMAHLSAWADYPEEDIPQVRKNLLKNKIEEIYSQVFKLKSTYSAVNALTNGLKIAVTGCPNVGKSSLLNLLMGYQRAIVTDVPGTTRDIIEGCTNIGDIPVTLLDTAGIRDTDNIVEKIGVEKALDSLSDSDIIFAVFDASKSLDKNDMKIIDMVDKNKSIAIINKIDLNSSASLDDIKKCFDRVVSISAKENIGLDNLKNAVYEFVGMNKINDSDAVISGQRQFDILNRAQDSLNQTLQAIDSDVTLDAVTVLIQDALSIIAEITGENVNEKVINSVFSKFCLGK